MLKPMLASDAVIEKIQYPCIIQPKIDGVRGLNLEGTLTGRSLKEHKNRYVTKLFSRPEFVGFDGEMAAAYETDLDLCRLTTSALSTIEGAPVIVWHLFDYITSNTIALPYAERYLALKYKLSSLPNAGEPLLRLVPSVLVHSERELLYHEDAWLSAGYEGLIKRDPAGLHKDGRSTVREGGLLRIKRFIEEDAVVEEILEGETNENEAQINELGQTFRSTQQANMVASGMVGAMICTLLKDVKGLDGKLLFRKGQRIKVAAGKMPHSDRERYFKHPALLLSNTIKFKMFPKGVKDKPRFPTFQSIRARSDVS